MAVGPSLPEVTQDVAPEPDQFPGGGFRKIFVSPVLVAVHVVVQFAVGEVVPAEVSSPLRVAAPAMGEVGGDPVAPDTTTPRTSWTGKRPADS